MNETQAAPRPGRSGTLRRAEVFGVAAEGISHIDILAARRRARVRSRPAGRAGRGWPDRLERRRCTTAARPVGSDLADLVGLGAAAQPAPGAAAGVDACSASTCRPTRGWSTARAGCSARWSPIRLAGRGVAGAGERAAAAAAGGDDRGGRALRAVWPRAPARRRGRARLRRDRHRARARASPTSSGAAYLHSTRRPVGRRADGRRVRRGALARHRPPAAARRPGAARGRAARWCWSTTSCPPAGPR